MAKQKQNKIKPKAYKQKLKANDRGDLIFGDLVTFFLWYWDLNSGPTP
jgi:hypothetical protein